MEFTFRELTKHEDFLATIALQKDAWGENFRDVTPPSTMVVNKQIGGFSAGAFDENGVMQGFVFGLTGVVKGENIQWSQKLAVNKNLRGYGLGFRLKTFQREQVLERGYKRIYWTYDPLQALNANLNINRLGVQATEYIEAWYPIDKRNILQANIGTDRFIVLWELTSPEVAQRLREKFKPMVSAVPAAEKIANTFLKDGSPHPASKKYPDGETVFVEIPENVNTIGLRDTALARDWRENTRAALQHYYENGYRVTEFVKIETRCFYLLENRS